MKKSKSFAVLLSLLLAFSITACSNSSGGSSDDNSSTNKPFAGEGQGGGGNTGGNTGGNGGGGSSGTTTLPYTVLPVGTNGSAGESNNTTITYVTFGSWPQSLKAAAVTIDTTAGTSTVNGWTVYTGSDGQNYVLEGGNYYKVEPIKWRILKNDYDHDRNSSTATKKLLLAENILMPMQYYDNQNNRTIGSATVHANNYKHSKVRAYLNGYSYTKDSTTNNDYLNNGFINKAFTASELAAIATDTVVDNSAASTTDSGNNITQVTAYACENTTDSIFLLSELEVTNTEYGFVSYNADGVNKRIRFPTDFAKNKGVHQSNTDGEGGFWRLRSPYGDDSFYAKVVIANGYPDSFNSVTDTEAGIVPALCLN